METNEPPYPKQDRSALVWIIIALAVVSVGYRLINGSPFGHSSLMFIGLPTALALVLTRAPLPGNATGVLMMTTTYLLLLSGILLIEGMVCILMAAPLFYGCALVIGLIMDSLGKGKRRGQVNCTLAVLFVVMSLEGVHESISFERDRTVEVRKTIPLSATAVEAGLSATPEFDLEALPMFFKIGFPRPLRVAGSGLEVGSRRTIHFAGGEGQPGDLILEVREREPGRVVFGCVSDSSKISSWLDWREVEVKWVEDGGQTKLSWNIRYRRLLDPAWYFSPLEDHAMREVASYLTASLLGKETE